jgi:hypothetical protein
VWEPASVEGVRPQVLEAVTANGVSACAVDADPHVWPIFRYAVDGQVLVRFEDVPGERSDPRYFTGVDVAEIVAAAGEAGLVLDPGALFDSGVGRGNTALSQQALLGVVVETPDRDDAVSRPKSHLGHRPNNRRGRTVRNYGGAASFLCAVTEKTDLL